MREWIGSTPADSVVQATYDEVGSERATVRRILNTRRADLIANPASFSIPGEYSQSTADNLKYIAALLEQLDDATFADDEATGTAPAPRVRRLVRDGEDEYVGR